MLTRDAILSLKIKLDKLDTSSLPEVPDEIAVFWINEATIRIIKQRAFGTNPKKESFEEDQKRMDDLRKVISYTTLTGPTNGFFPNSKAYSLPPDYWFAVVEQVDVTQTCGVTSQTSREGVKAIQHNNINVVTIKDPFNKPKKLDVLRVMQGDTIVVFHDPTVTLGTFYLGYIDNNFKIDVNDLDAPLKMPDHIQPEIIDLAYSMILEAVESGRYQQNLQELLKTE